VEIILIASLSLLFTVGAFLIMRPHLIKVAIGFILFTNGVNLLIFSAGRLTRSVPPIIKEGQSELLVPSANPLSQALILTSIVIGFGFLSFVLVLVFRAYSEFGRVNSDLIRVRTKERS